MAVSRWGIAFWVGCVRSQGRRQPIITQSWSLSQTVEWQWIRQARPLSSASWALAPPNSLRYQSVRQPVLSHPLQHGSPPPRAGGCEADWEESVSVCVLVQQGESDGPHTLLEIPVSAHNILGELLAQGAHRPPALAFPLTTVDGSREDDISVDGLKRRSADAAKTEHGCFRSLFEAERCPAPFMFGSHFYCFHCPGTELAPGSGLKPHKDCGPDRKPVDVPVLPPTSLCSHVLREGGEHTEGERDREEKLAMMFERLRTELPGFFGKSHDYSMYSNDVEFINGLLNTKTRGRGVYQFTVSLWRLLCLCYYASVQLEVLKLTKHMEDGTIKARWRVRGLPLLSLLLRFYRRDKSQLYRSYDAFSTFYIGGDGLIHCHKVEKMMPVQPPLLPRVTSLLAGTLVALGVQDHRPALNLLPLLLHSLRQGRN